VSDADRIIVTREAAAIEEPPGPASPVYRAALRVMSAYGEVGVAMLGPATGLTWHGAIGLGRELVALGLAREGLASEGKNRTPTFALTPQGRDAARAQGEEM